MEHSPLMMQGAFTSGKVLEVKAPLDPPDIATEIFGKVLCVYFYSRLDHACAIANSLPFAFQAAMFTTGIDTTMQVYRRIDGSAVMVNDHTAFREDWKTFAGLMKSRRLGTGSVPHTNRNKQVEKMPILHSAAL